MNGHELATRLLELLGQPWPMLVLKLTAVLAAGWLGHAILRHCGPRHRLFWWRGIACSAFLVVVVGLWGPAIPIRAIPADTQHADHVAAADEIVAKPLHHQGRAVVAEFPAAPLEPAPPEPAGPPAANTQRTTEEAGATSSDQVRGLSTVGATAARPRLSAIQWIFRIWLAGVFVLSLLQLSSWVRVRRVLRDAEPAPDEITSACRQLVTAAGCRQQVSVQKHAGISSPVLSGVLRPVILLPTWMCEQDSRNDWPGVFAHELSHVRSFDLFWQRVIHVLSVLLWFHPLAWRLQRTHLMFCELKADLDSARLLGETRDYVRTLARVALAVARPAAGVGLAMARTSDISRRLSVLKSSVLQAPPSLRRLIATGLCGLLLPLAVGGLQLAAAESDEEPNTTTTEKDRAKSPPSGTSTERLTVRIIDEKGKPVRGVSLVVRREDDLKNVRPDEKGNVIVKIPRPVPSRVVLTVKAPRHVRMQARWYNRPGRMPEPIPQSITFRMERGTTIGGKVVDKNGKPIRNANVRVSASGRRATRANPTSQSISDFNAKTNAKGEWRCNVAPSKLTRVSLTLSHKRYVGGSRYTGVRSNLWPKLRDFSHVSVMERGYLIEGHVHGPDGKPVVGAVLALGNSPFGVGGRVPRPKTDKNGAFRFENVKAGDTAITVLAKGLAPELRRIDVSEELDSVDFRLKKGKTIRFKVLDKNGKPIPDARIVPDTWRGHRTLLGLYSAGIPHTTDKNGRMVWTAAPHDEIRFDIYKRNYMRARDQAIKPRDKEYVITLPPALQISGRVIDAKTKKPIPKFKVIEGIRFRTTDRTFFNRYRTADGRKGKYLLELTSPYRQHYVRIEAPGYGPQVSRAIKSDEGNITINFELTKAQGPTGTVLTTGGKPIANAEVILMTPTSGAYVRNGATADRDRGIRTKTDKAGNFTFQPQSGAYTVLVVADAGYAIVQQADLERKPEIRVRLWAKVTGTLKVGGKPGRNLQVSLSLNDVTRAGTPRAHFDYDATTDSKGRFEFTRVPTHLRATIYRRIVLARFGGTTRIGSSHNQLLKLMPGKTTKVSLGGIGRPVIGRLQLPKSEKRKVDWNAGRNYIRTLPPAGFVPMPGVPRPFLPNYSIRVNPDGSFRVEDVPPGQYELIVFAYERKLDNGRPFDRGTFLGRLRMPLTIKPIPGGRTDKPRDLGVLKLK